MSRFTAATDTLQDLRNRFRYKADRGDRWNLLDAPTGPLEGDCEDFALTTLWLVAGKSWGRLWWLVLTCQAMIWQAQLVPGEGHRMLWVRQYGWIDNNQQQWSPKPPASRRWPIFAPLLALTLLLKRRK